MLGLASSVCCMCGVRTTFKLHVAVQYSRGNCRPTWIWIELCTNKTQRLLQVSLQQARTRFVSLMRRRAPSWHRATHPKAFLVDAGPPQQNWTVFAWSNSF